VNRSTYFGWLFLAVWAAWLSALSGHLAQFGWLGRWAPDLGLSLFVALSARAQVSDIAKFAICFGLARASVSIDAPAAVLAAALGLGAALRLARTGVQVDHAVIAAALAFLLCIAQDAWLEFVHLRTRGVEIAGLGSIEYAWRAGLSSAIVTALFGGVLANLPGLRSLIRRKTWAVGASHR
jgi:hypothetical protein